MKTKELIEWVLRAQEWHEHNWDVKKNKFSHLADSLRKTTIGVTSHADYSIAYVLLRDFWNDCQEWVNEFDLKSQ